MVMGGDSRSEGCGLESQRHFFTLFVVKLCLYLFEKTKNKQKRGRGWPIKKLFRANQVKLSNKLCTTKLKMKCKRCHLQAQVTSR